MDREFKIRVDDSKPHLKRLMEENPKLAQEVIGTFVIMMEHAVANGWHELPRQFHPQLNFVGLIGDILHGVLDIHAIDPEFANDLGAGVHPFSLFSQPMPDMSKTTNLHYYDWQRHFDWKKGDLPPIQSILRKLMYYARYIEVDKLADALWHDEKYTYLVERDPAGLLGIQPALRYQKEHIGERQVGKLMDKYGLFDCGKLEEGHDDQCPACTVGQLREIDTHVWACVRCGAGFTN